MTAPVPDPEAAVSGDADLDPAAALGGSYSVKLPVFEGPLDLLLHLIRMNEVEITEIPIARIGEQYLEYLGYMRELNLDVVGEYLVMASTLAWIKSRMLLPVERIDEDGEEVDPRAELIARLLEYQRFKEVAVELGERPRLDRNVFAAPGATPDRPSDEEREIEVGLFDLVEAYRRVLAAKREVGPLPHEIEVEEITVRDRMIAVMRILEQQASLEFEVMLREERPGAISRSFLVATFLAILELTRLGAVRIYQGIDELSAPQGPIHMRRVAAPGDATWSEQIGELM